MLCCCLNHLTHDVIKAIQTSSVHVSHCAAILTKKCIILVPCFAFPDKLFTVTTDMHVKVKSIVVCQKWSTQDAHWPYSIGGLWATCGPKAIFQWPSIHKSDMAKYVNYIVFYVHVCHTHMLIHAI